MSAEVQPLGLLDVAISAALVILAGAISLGLRLGLERRIAWAALRTVVQLTAVGYVLTFVFGVDRVAVVLGALAIMIVAASRAAVRRSERRYRGAYRDAFVTLLVTGSVTTGVVTQLVIGVDPWYRPQYLIPLLGMVLGNSLTGISLCLDDLLRSFDEHRDAIEMRLALGATAGEASRDALQEAVRRGMIPILNSMSVVGIVSLPGMMTGQILAGAPPLTAVAYQIVVMFMIAAACALGCMICALLVRRRLFDERHQLRSDRIERVDR